MVSTTVLLLNWKRPNNLRKIIESLRQQSEKCIIWLWNNNPNIKEDFNVDFQINSPKNMMCFPRWALASLVETKYVMVIDDDIALCKINTLRILREIHDMYDTNGNKRVIVGPYGQNLAWDKPETPYTSGSLCDTSRITEDTYVDVIKGRCMFMKKNLLDNFPLKYEDRVEDLKVSSYGNIKVVSPSLANKFLNLNEGNVGLFTQRGHYEARNNATKRFFNI